LFPFSVPFCEGRKIIIVQSKGQQNRGEKRMGMLEGNNRWEEKDTKLERGTYEAQSQTCG
jgi:hypothetical protein